MQELKRLVRWFLILTLGLLFLLYFFPHLQTGIYKEDDITVSWMGYTKTIFAPSLEWAAYQGRFFFLVATPTWTLPYLIDHPAYFNSVRLLAHLSVFVSFLFLLWTLTRDRLLTALSGAFFCTFLANHLSYNSLNACTPGYHISLAGLMTSGAAFHRGLNGSRSWMILSSISLFASFLMTEVGFSYLPFFGLIAWHFRPEVPAALRGIGRHPKSSLLVLWRTFAPIVSVVILFLVPYFLFKLKWPSSYPGNQVALETGKFFPTLWKLSLGLFPTVAEHGHLEQKILASYVPDYSLGIKGILAVLRSIQAIWLVKVALVAALMAFIARTEGSDGASIRTLRKTLVISIILIFVPNVLVSLTPKYQSWPEPNYLFTTYSFFAICVALSSGYLLLIKRVKPGAVRNSAVFFTVLLTTWGSLKTDFLNEFTFLEQARVFKKWTAFKISVQSHLLNKKRENVIFAPEYIDRSRPEYWTNYMRTHGAAETIVTRDFDEFRRLSRTHIPYVLRNQEDAQTTNQFSVFARVTANSFNATRPEDLKSNKLAIFDFSKHPRLRVLGKVAPLDTDANIAIIDGRGTSVRLGGMSLFDLKVFKSYVLSSQATVLKGEGLMFFPWQTTLNYYYETDVF